MAAPAACARAHSSRATRPSSTDVKTASAGECSVQPDAVARQSSLVSRRGSPLEANASCSRRRPPTGGQIRPLVASGAGSAGAVPRRIDLRRPWRGAAAVVSRWRAMEIASIAGAASATPPAAALSARAVAALEAASRSSDPSSSAQRSASRASGESMAGRDVGRRPCASARGRGRGRAARRRRRPRGSRSLRWRPIRRRRRRGPPGRASPASSVMGTARGSSRLLAWTMTPTGGPAGRAGRRSGRPGSRTPRRAVRASSR